jgi:hypothetical protein
MPPQQSDRLLDGIGVSLGFSAHLLFLPADRIAAAIMCM